MWGIWFILSAICFGTAAYLLKKRISYVYAPKEVLYSAAKDAPRQQAHVHTEPAPIEAEYSVEPKNTSPPPQTASFFSEMSGAAAAEEMPKTPPENAQPENAENENEPASDLKNIRFFDS